MTQSTFAELGLPQPLLKALETEGYHTPTPIQAQAIPVVLRGVDLLGIAQTGTGKTAAFALPILSRLAADPKPAMRRGCRVLVLAPTRELAAQIGDSFRTYGRLLGTRVAVVFGGVGHRPQIDVMARGVDVLVATPGRLLDHVGSGAIVLSGTEILVLDEVDQMLDLGFVRPIRRIVAELSSRRQSLFFSATMPAEIRGLAMELLTEPVRVSAAPVATTAERVRQRVLHVRRDRKRDVLVELLADETLSRTLVFTRTKRGADRVAHHLDTSGISASAIHGNKSQRQREIALEKFRDGKIRVLVATDIAARGIDIDAVSHVINFELPEVPEAYVHRIGRTARAGAEGQAISLCDSEERDQLRDIERLIRQTIPAEHRGDSPRATTSGEQDAMPERRSSRGGSDRGHGRPRREGETTERQARPRRADRERAPFERDGRDGERRDVRPAVRFGDTGVARSSAPRSQHSDRDADRPRRGGSSEHRASDTRREHRSDTSGANVERRGESSRAPHKFRNRDNRPTSDAAGAERRGYQRRDDGDRPQTRSAATGRNHESRRDRSVEASGSNYDRPRHGQGPRRDGTGSERTASRERSQPERDSRSNGSHERGGRDRNQRPVQRDRQHGRSPRQGAHREPA